MNLATIAKEYKSLVESGDSLEVIRRFYADDIVQVENNAEPVCGKQLLLEMEINNIAGVYDFTLTINSMIVDEVSQKIMGEMTVQFHSKKDGRKLMHEAFVQQWQNNKIKYQRFYYGRIESIK